MVELAIRDDDLNFFSKVEDLEFVYRTIDYCPVSYAVIPTVTDVSTIGSCKETRNNTTPKWIGDNHNLSLWLSKGLEQGRIDVLMHGISHEYHFENGVKLPEMIWRKEDNLTTEILYYKNKLEELLNYKIKVFVAPSNKISIYGLKCVANSGMNYSGIVPIRYEREMSYINMLSWAKRVLVRTIYGIPYPGVLRYSDHLEINACAIHDFNYLKKIFNYCNKRDLPMALNVHYWHIRDNMSNYKAFYDFVHYALDNGACPVPLSQLFK